MLITRLPLLTLLTVLLPESAKGAENGEFVTGTRFSGYSYVRMYQAVIKCTHVFCGVCVVSHSQTAISAQGVNARAYTASDNTLRRNSGLTTRD